jgi:hypothetical protein
LLSSATPTAANFYKVEKWSRDGRRISGAGPACCGRVAEELQASSANGEGADGREACVTEMASNDRCLESLFEAFIQILKTRGLTRFEAELKLANIREEIEQHLNDCDQVDWCDMIKSITAVAFF